MSFLISVLTGFKFLERRSDDDFVDRLHYSLTTNILIGLSILVSWKQFGGKPVECMPPDQYPSSWEQYVENFCWAQDTYHVPADEELGLDHESYKSQGRVTYYKWVPFCLLFTAMSFQLPYYLWKMLSHRSGVMLIHIIQHASDPKNVIPEVRTTTIDLISKYLQNALRFQKRLRHRNRRFVPPSVSMYVTVVYILVKLAYFFTTLTNFMLMNFFLSGGGKTVLQGAEAGGLYGWNILKETLNGTDWNLSGFFPRVTVCDFKARVTGFIQQHSIQCVLVINMFNEKIFVFLWFWYHFLMLVSTLSVSYWSFVSLTPLCRKWFIVRHLEMADTPFEMKSDSEKVEKFVFDYLKIDGLFILRMLNNHTGAIFTSDLVAELWKAFLELEKRQPTADRWLRLDRKLSVGNKSLDDPNYRTLPADIRKREKREGSADELTSLGP